jgi:hypothetical protein
MLSIRIVLFGAVVPLLMRRAPLPRLAARLEPRRVSPAPSHPEAAEALVRRIDRLLWRAWPLVRRGCLVRGVTRYRFLRQAGFDAVLCFGMGRLEEDGALMGHCWIEQGGRALAEPREPRPIYKEMFRVSPHAVS